MINEQKRASDSEMTECQFHNNCGGWCETRRELEHNLCEHCLESHDEEMYEPAKAPLHQGEPVALPERRDPLFVVGSAYDDGLCVGFNECLDEIAKLGPLYARADSGEVERLREEYEKLWIDFVKVDNENDKLRAGMKGDYDLDAWLAFVKDRDTLRAELAERDALLRDTKTMLASELSYELFQKMAAHIKRIDAALSASAEPSAPKCDGNHGGPRCADPECWNDTPVEVIGVDHLEGQPITPTCGVLAGEPEVVGERCADGGKCHHMCKTKCSRKVGCVPLTASGLTDDWKDPSAPVERDERAEFEEASEPDGANLERNSDGDYVNPYVQSSWEGWSMRAALERKP